MQIAGAKTTRLFQLILIKPSHYDDDGYVIQWARSSIPANTLAALNGLALDCAERRVLGDGVEIRVTAWDETNTRIRPDRIIRQIRESDGRGLVALVGVQSNQFPRAVDIARPLRAAGIPVCIGGFHVSGCIAMLPQLRPSCGRQWMLVSRSSPGKPRGDSRSCERPPQRPMREPRFGPLALRGADSVPRR